MHLFRKRKPKKERNLGQETEDAAKRVAADFKAWRDVGECFEYLGVTMCVYGHLRWRACGFVGYHEPCILARYVDKNGVLHDFFFEAGEAQRLTKMQPNYCSAAKNDIATPSNPAPKPHYTAE